MKVYLAGVAAGCVALSLVELISPDGKTKRCVAAALSVAFVAIALAPVLKSETDSFVFPSLSIDGEVVTDKNVEDTVAVRLSEIYSEDLKKMLKDIDLIAERVDVEICRGEIEKIEVYLSNLVITDDCEHINSNVIADYVCERLEINKEILAVYV